MKSNQNVNVDFMFRSVLTSKLRLVGGSNIGFLCFVFIWDQKTQISFENTQPFRNLFCDHLARVYTAVTFNLWQSLTWTSPEMFDIYLLLFHAGRLSHETGVMVRVSICAAHRVFIVSAAVDFTRTAATNINVWWIWCVMSQHDYSTGTTSSTEWSNFVSPWGYI